MLRGTKANVTRPIGDSATHFPSTNSTDEPKPRAHVGRLAGSEAKSETSTTGRLILVLMCREFDAIRSSSQPGPAPRLPIPLRDDHRRVRASCHSAVLTAGPPSRSRRLASAGSSAAFSLASMRGNVPGMAAQGRRTALVTGGSRGIGRAIVERLVRDGVSVVFSFARDKAAADEVLVLFEPQGPRA